MTRTEFIEDVTQWYELISFCEDYRCDVCENVVSSECRDDEIEENLVDLARNNTWGELRDILNGYYDETGYDYYAWDENYGEYEGLNDYDDFQRYKDEVLSWMDEEGYWEEDEEEEDAVCEESPVPGFTCEVSCEDDDWQEPEEECSVFDMIDSGVGCIVSVSESTLEDARMQDKAFAEFAF